MSRSSFGFFFLLISLGICLPVQAQFTGTDPLTLDVSPQYPSPYQYVTITPQSTVFDMAATTVTVTSNGTRIWNGSGSQPVNVQVGGAGSQTTIVVTAVNGGKTYTDQLVIRPTSVALVEEAIATTHPFYEGGALPAAQGRMRIVAVPDFRTDAGARISPNDLVYTWKFGDQVLESQSGIGKSVLSVLAPMQYRDGTLSVTVTTADTSLAAQATIDIVPVSPSIRIYLDDPLLGPLFDQAISGNYTLSGDEDTFRAVPYNFASTPSLAWSVNNTLSSSDKDVTVRAAGSGNGNASLSVLATPAAGYETATAALSVAFGSKNPLGIFGL